MSDHSDHTIYLPAEIQVGETQAQYVVSSARVRENNGRDEVLLWIRGVFSGVCIMNRGDAALLLEKLGLVHRACPGCGKHGPHEHDHEPEAP